MAKSWLEKSLKKVKLNESKISTILGIAVVVVIGLLLFNYFRGLKNSTQQIPTETSEQESQEVEGTTESGEGQYVVQKGDNLWKIAENKYKSGFRWVDIAKANNLSSPYEIEIGETLSLPQLSNEQADISTIQNKSQNSTIESDTYLVQKGDSLWKIAVRAFQDGYQWEKIAKANNLVNPSLIHPGNNLSIPR